MQIQEVKRRVEQFEPAESAWLIGLAVGGIAVAGGAVLAFGGVLAGLAVVLALVAAYIVLRYIEVGFWAIIAIVCLLPFAALPVNIGLKPTFLDLALGGTVAVWALGIATGRQRTIITAPIALPLLIFIILAIFSFIFGLSHGPLTTTLLRRFAELILSLAFALVIIDYCASWERLERLVKALLLAGGGAALIGIGLWLLPEATANSWLNALQRVGYPGGWVIRYIEENPELAERAIGTSVDPNALGGLLLMIGALAAPQIAGKRPLLPRWLIFLIAGLVFLCLILTFSRGALVGLAAGLGFVALARYRRLIPYMLLGGALFFFLPMGQEYVERFVAGLMGADLATQMRFGEYRDALALIQRYPIFGVGFSGSPDIDLYLGVASVYLTIGQRMGVLGLLSFTAVMAALFGYAFFNRAYFRARPRRDGVWLGLHAAVIGGLVAGVFDHYLFNIDFHHAVTIFWFLVGLAAAATRLGAQKKDEMP